MNHFKRTKENWTTYIIGFGVLGTTAYWVGTIIGITIEWV